MMTKKPPHWVSLPEARPTMTNEDDIVSRWIDSFCHHAAKLVPNYIINLRYAEGESYSFPEAFLSPTQIENGFYKAAKQAVEKLLLVNETYRQSVVNLALDPEETAKQLAPLIAQDVVKGITHQ